jgi:glyceraldehyde 3-phosphate dehydrogenase
MACRIGINGLGRIGRMVLRHTLSMPDVEVVAINDLANLGNLASLVKYDSVHGGFSGEVSHRNGALQVNGKAVHFFSEKEPAKIPWGMAGVNVVLECTGAFRGRDVAVQHFAGRRP